MKYIIMCGTSGPEFNVPRQLTEINGERLVDRTIRLLRENGINDIYISSNNPMFDDCGIPRLEHKGDYKYWLEAYYPLEEPCCYLHGDVYFSEEAIKTIVNTEVENTMFFCTFDKTDGETHPQNWKGREPFAYKVQNQKVFRYAINKLIKMIDDGEYKNLLPISWHVYRFLNGYDVKREATEYTEVNNIFQSKGDYTIINDYTTDIDCVGDIQNIKDSLEK